MSIPFNNLANPFDPFDDTTIKFDYEDTAYQGKMIKVTMDLDALTTVQFNDAELRKLIKHELAQKLAKGMIQNNLIEFTSSDDSLTGIKRVYARCFLTPDDNVRIIRMAKQKR